MLTYLFFSFRKEYNLLEDLGVGGCMLLTEKKMKTASEVKRGRGKLGEEQEEQAQPKVWDPSR